MSKVCITGANRGIGLELCRIAKTRGDQVLAVCRNASAELTGLGVDVWSGIDVGEEESIAELRDRCGSIDILINNAGVLSNERLGEIDYGAIHKQLAINAVAPLRVSEALIPKIQPGGKIAMITSRMGSIADNSSGGYYGYRMSKAALNAASKSLAIDLKSKEIAVAILHPGFVKTEMTGHQGNDTPKDAAENLWRRIDELTMANTGSFWHASGETLPW